MKPVEIPLIKYLSSFAEKEGEKVFLFNENVRLTASQSYSAVLALVALLKENGVKRGDNVAVCFNISIETAIVFLSLQALGAVAVLCDNHTSPEKFIEECGIAVPVSHYISSLDSRWTLDRKDLQVICTDSCIEASEVLADIDVNEPAIIVFTSGSTGTNKGVVLSQYNYINHQRNFSVVSGVQENEIAIQMLPMFHVFGLTQLIDAVLNGYSVFFPKEITPDYICRCIEKYKITRIAFVPAFAVALAQARKEKGYKINSLRVAAFAGAPSTREQFYFIQEQLSVKNVPIYGLSECIGVSGGGQEEDDEDRASSVGKIFPMNQVKIVHKGILKKVGEEGEICVKGPAVMLGYFGDEEATAEVIDAEGYLHTGDLGYLDEKGFLHITGRIKDIIIRNGNNLSAAKIERKLASLPCISQVAVVGVKSAECGEAPAAVIVVKEGCTFDMAEMENVLVKNEIPVAVKLVDRLPLTSSGKPDKPKIKEMF